MVTFPAHVSTRMLSVSHRAKIIDAAQSAVRSPNFIIILLVWENSKDNASVTIIIHIH